MKNTERNRQLEMDDKKYLWHPFTQMQVYVTEKPPIIEEGYGCILKDIEGNEYLDGVSSLWTNVHGHRRQEIDQAVRRQLDLIAHSTLLGLSSVPAIEFAERLIGIAPHGLTRVFYSDSGSTAVEIALKIAFQYHQQAPAGNPARKKFISFVNAYHGDTIGSVSVGGIDLFHQMYRPMLFDSFKAESCYCYRCTFGKSHPGCDMQCLKQLEEVMAEHADEVCALVIEPLVQGAAGILVHPRGYLKEVRELCTRYGIFMIADEVAVGFGKTGRMFACEHEGVVPDLMALAKGISGGYLPLAATLATDEIYQGFLGKYEDFRTFFHGHTYTGNPLACAAAIASLEVFEKENVLERLQVVIARLKERLAEFYGLRHVGDVRQCGIMTGIELVSDRDSKEPFPLKENIGHQVTLEARKQGLIIRPLGGVIVLMPPLAVSVAEIDRICDITFASIRKVTEGKGR